jgi:hypothetical protein
MRYFLSALVSLAWALWFGGLIAIFLVVTQITPNVEAMRVAGHTDAPEFKKLHGMSMMVYSADAVILLIAGMVLPAALKTGRDTSTI